MKRVNILLRTHSGPNVHPGDRVLQVPKEQLIFGCLRSLVRAMRDVDPLRYSLRIFVFDDHSAESCVSGLRLILNASGFAFSFVPFEETGPGPSLGFLYEYARGLEGDELYFVEDDYLHSPSALSEMLEAQEVFSKNLGGQEVAIFPVDYPDKYDPRLMRRTYLVPGPRRHWHSDDSSTGTFLLSQKAFIANFHHFIRMRHYMIDLLVSEESSINRVWREGGVQLFRPAPSLAIHMQTADVIPPFVDWRKWWEEFAR